ncbi:glycosyltransferase [Levilactobacillus namurensis]|uniref:glycosyltransferase n=1 Tax=Levilactobacillus namurensis TaxID=380393 RepID=UPI00222F2FDA|nr:glycosyltransferase [Levilactobacillus namurensis]MCW3779562.1 glycosyltransferase [Levilactobacillus namurensis]MDT7018144.1 glycosyltransferase [Levilactobacillus namurensis]WNN64867.1 glycosyltransferase [Levilactobacillus namurensis]
MVSVSVTTVLYNNSNDQIEKFVLNMLSVMRDFDCKIYLVNNSSENDRLRKFLKKYKDNRICVINSSKNGGVAYGNNAVLSNLKSDYHFVVNPDVYVSDDVQIKKMINYMESNPQYGLLSPLIKFPSGKIQHLLKKEATIADMALRFIGLPIFKKRKARFVNLPDGYSSIHDAENVPGSFMLFRTSIFESIGGFDESYFLYMEDSDITRKVNQVSKSVFFPDAFVYHEWQRENRKSVRGVIQMLRSMKIYFNKWGWKLW